MVSSFFGLSPVAACAPALPGMAAAAATAHTPASSTVRRDMALVLMAHFLPLTSLRIDVLVLDAVGVPVSLVRLGLELSPPLHDE